MYKVPHNLKVGDLVRYRYDPASTKTYIIATVDDVGCLKTIERFATLFGWNQLNCVGSVQRFRVDQLEVISSCK